MIVTHEIKMDLTCPGVAARVEVMQADKYSRDLAVSLFSGGRPWYPGPETAAVVRYRKADGLGGTYDTLPDGTRAWAVRENVVTVAVAPQVCTAAGTVRLAVCLVRGERELHTFVIELNVRPNPGSEAVSEGYYNLRGYLPDWGWEPEKLLGTDAEGRVAAVEPVKVDATLTLRGGAADARAVGVGLEALSARIEAAGGLPMPAAAAVGQYFRVAAVDENGAVTAVEAVDLPSEQPGTCRYNGTELPALPVYDPANPLKAGYTAPCPYAVIGTGSDTGHAYDCMLMSAVGLIDDEGRFVPPIYTDEVGYVQIHFYYPADGAWVYRSSALFAPGTAYSGKPIWTNADLYWKSDPDTLAMAATASVCADGSVSTGYGVNFPVVTLDTTLAHQELGPTTLTEADSTALTKAFATGLPAVISVGLCSDISGEVQQTVTGMFARIGTDEIEGFSVCAGGTVVTIVHTADVWVGLWGTE